MHPDVAAIFRAVSQRITGEPEEISAGCGATLFAAVWGDDKALARNLIGGSARLPQALAERLGARVVTRARVEEVAAEPGGTVRVRVREPHGTRELAAGCAIVATPAYVTRAIVRDLPDDTRAALDGIPYGPFVCGAFLTAEPGPMPWDGIYAIAVAGRSFNMLFNHANVLRGAGPREPGGSLMVYGGGDAARRLLPLGDDRIEAAFLEDLHALLPETRGIVKEVRIQRWEKALPFARPGRRLLQPALERPLGPVFLAGDYLEFAEMEVGAETGRDAARAARRRLDGAAACA
jgi:oxygen-dependent protoporphyrinogen oxidase